MNQIVAVVEQHPLSVLIAFYAVWPLTQFSQLGFDFIGNRLNLPGVCAATDDKEIGKRSDFTKIQDNNVFGLL
jgi:hypothetical protein